MRSVPQEPVFCGLFIYVAVLMSLSSLVASRFALACLLHAEQLAKVAVNRRQ